MNVELFIPCFIDQLYPQTAFCTIKILEKAGCKVIYNSEQTCCGQPAINAGYTREARLAAKHFIDVFGDDEVIVSPSGSCVCTVKTHYPELLANEPSWRERAEALAPRIYELSQYIVDVLGVSDCGARYDGKIAYHESCHILRGLGVSTQPKKLLSCVREAKLVPLRGAETCCGFGGEFAAGFRSSQGNQLCFPDA